MIDPNELGIQRGWNRATLGCYVEYYKNDQTPSKIILGQAPNAHWDLKQYREMRNTASRLSGIKISSLQPCAFHMTEIFLSEREITQILQYMQVFSPKVSDK